MLPKPTRSDRVHPLGNLDQHPLWRGVEHYHQLLHERVPQDVGPVLAGADPRQATPVALRFWEDYILGEAGGVSDIGFLYNVFLNISRVFLFPSFF